ncbi:MAG: hypothetical protein RLZZ59_702 [Pseudomonadota bacterium]|jgi:subfamily B ATP-binding cassette protein MsbA
MQKIQDKYTSKYIIKRLIKNHVRQYSGKLITAAVFMVICAAANAIIVNLVQPMINDVLIARDKTMLMILPLTMLIVSAMKGGAEYMQGYLVKIVGQRIVTDLQILLYGHLLKSDLSLIESQSSGRLISRFSNDISLMRGAVSNLLVGAAKHLLSIIFLIGVMIKLEPMMFFICFGAFPLAVYPIQILGKKMRKIASSAQEELGNYTAKLDESFHSIKIVKSYLAERQEVDSAKKTTEMIFEFYKKAAKFDSLSSPIMEILSGIAVASIVWYGGYLIFHDRTTPGALFAFLTAFIAAYRPYKSLVQLNVNLQEGLAAAKRLFQILDIKPQVVDLPDAKEIKITKSIIEFDNVSLEFSAKSALHGASFIIAPHTTVALVGKSGSGKTTISNLLVRFYDPSSGAIRIDGHDLRELTIESLRKQIALVTQDTVLFDASIADNIAYGMPKATRKEIIAAAKKAHADEFIDHLKDGYDTMIGYQGSTLSGGQKQRIAIARAFLKDAPILILDEATSALDSNAERAIEESLRELRQNRTTIIITHKLSSITDVDKIIVMKKGVILETGSHKSLISKKGEYYELYNKQMGKEFGG